MSATGSSDRQRTDDIETGKSIAVAGAFARAESVDVYASEAEFIEIEAALALSPFCVQWRSSAPGTAGSGQAARLAIVSESVPAAIELCRSLAGAQTVILLCTKADFACRLAAVRANVRVVIDRPIDPIELISCLDELEPAGNHRPISVVLIDDDWLAAELLGQVLQSAGIETHVVNEPARAIETIECVMPDLILMDLRMPEVDGVDLARVIRLSRNLVSIPITFLSAERSGERQSAARRVAADDFIQKPVAPEQLIAQVRLRADRAKALRSISERDGLTGLLDQSRFRQRLIHELASSQRDGGVFSLALIDLDLFKSINDPYGHLIGDKVLRAAAQLLSASLRQTDIIGRCGGEEFGVILRNTDVAAAYRVIDDVRERFGAIPFESGAADFTVTFSAGVAGNRGHQLATDLLAAADGVLYAAKSAGRNRVIPATSIERLSRMPVSLIPPRLGGQG